MSKAHLSKTHFDKSKLPGADKKPEFRESKHDHDCSKSAPHDRLHRGAPQRFPGK
ncbi:MAG: hypothetical protein NTU49_09130 [Gammaproteobacteria bacterium]|nr:hypothetical protein [Gammaproteobacteria bacterium]